MDMICYVFDSEVDFLLVVFLCIQRRNKISVGRSVLRLKEDGSDGAETRLRLVGRLS